MATIMMAFVSTKVMRIMAMLLLGTVGPQGIMLLSLLPEMLLAKLHMLPRLHKQIGKKRQMAPRVDVAVAPYPLKHLIHHRRHHHRPLIVDVEHLIQRQAEWHLVGSQRDVMVTEFQQMQLVGELNQTHHLALGSGVSLVLQQKAGPLEVTLAQRELVSLCKSTSSLTISFGGTCLVSDTEMATVLET